MRVFGAILVLVFAAPCFAVTTFTVDNLNDSGAGSLRQAITDANTTPGVDDIVFSPTLASSYPGDLVINSTLPTITEEVTIQGPGRANLTIKHDGGGTDYRAFNVADAIPFRIESLTIADFAAPTGGAIFNDGELVVTDVLITNCHARDATGANVDGGAIYSNNGGGNKALTVTNSTIQNCTADAGTSSMTYNARGGAIYISKGALWLSSVTIRNCKALGSASTSVNAGGSASGGAVYSDVGITFIDGLVELCEAVGGDNNSAGDGGSAFGGGIYHRGLMSITRCTLRDNKAQGGSASNGGASTGGANSGGVYVANALFAVLDMNGCTLESNSAIAGPTAGAATVGQSNNGAIGYYGTGIDLFRTRVTGNTADDAAIGIYGSGTMNMSKTTIDNNTGVGIEAHFSGTMTLENVTISGNTSTTTGGGVYVNTGTFNIRFSTITLNSGPVTGGVLANGTVTVSSSIVAGNLSTSTDKDLGGAGGLVDGGNNVIGVADSGGTIVDGANGNQVGTSGSPLDAMLSSLQNYGGTVPTHAIDSNSPAVDAGNPAGAPTEDARDATRDSVPDAGAYEYGATPPGTTGNAGGDGDSGGGCATQAGTHGAWWLLLLATVAGLVWYRRQRA